MVTTLVKISLLDLSIICALEIGGSSGRHPLQTARQISSAVGRHVGGVHPCPA